MWDTFCSFIQVGLWLLNWLIGVPWGELITTLMQQRALKEMLYFAMMFVLLRFICFFKSKDRFSGGEKKSCHQLLNLVSFYVFIPQKLLVTMILLFFF